MALFENLRIALGALRANPMRATLTTLGIIIAVAAVIAVVSVIQGLQHMIVGQFQDLGTNFLQVAPQIQQQQGIQSARQVRLTWEDGQALERELPGIDLISPVVVGRVEMKYRDRRHRPDFVYGVNDDFPEVVNHFVEEGRFFTDLDLRLRRKVVVVGRQVVEELRLGNDPIGKEVYVESLPATVIGVLEEKGRLLGTDMDDVAYIPFDTSLSIFGRRAGEQVQLNMKTEPGAMDEVYDGVERVLRRRHEIPEGERNDFQLWRQDDLLDAIGTVLGGVTAVIGGVVGIALVVGGIGIMNIMLVSVTERTKEIGIRKAVGARKRDILMQFLIEAVVLSVFGGVLGILLGYGAGSAVVALLPVDLPPVYVPLWAIALAFGFSAAVGIFFGIYPAGKAARLDPIEALRYE